MRKVYLLPAVIGAWIGTCSCAHSADEAVDGKPFFAPFGIDLTAIDAHVRPQDDFFRYVNGAWIDRTPIPLDEDRVSAGRDAQNRVSNRLHTLLEQAGKGLPRVPKTSEQKVGAMYVAYMDEQRIEKLGYQPVQQELRRVVNAKNKEEIARLMGTSMVDFGAAPYIASVDIDLKDTAHYAIYLNQAGLGMPDRDYYLKADFAPQKAAYRDYIVALLSNIHWRSATVDADAIVAFETEIAKRSWTKAEQRDADNIYNPMTTAELVAYAPGFPWNAFLQGAELGDHQRFIIGEKTAFPKIAEVFATTPLPVLKAWLSFQILDTAAPYLSSSFQHANFEFRGKSLEGQAVIAPRWKRAVAAVSGGDCGVAAKDCWGTLNWAVGEVYVKHDFTPETKRKVLQLVAQILDAYHRRIEALDWMSPATKIEALKKLETYKVKVGYPDHLRDYRNVSISASDLVGDVRNAAKADWDFYVKRSAGAVDLTDWSMTPQTDDAYNGSLRDIVFPAAILQPPTFDPNADDAVNYGSIGVIIGHELTHGFDDQGRKVDASGALRDWWTSDDAAAFNSRAAALGAQFARFEVLPGVFINPDLTMGENIADLGGVVIALDAYHASLHGQDAPVLGGLRGDQRFFMAHAQNWRGKLRDDAIKKQTASDPHSYRTFRVLGPISNVDAWYDAFNVKSGDKLFRPESERVRIW